MIKLFIGFLFVFEVNSLIKAQTPYVLDSVVTQLCDVQWQEVAYYLEEGNQLVLDTSAPEKSMDRMSTMLLFSDTSKISDERWTIYVLPFYFRDEKARKEGKMTVSSHDFMKSEAIIHNGKVVIDYSEFDGRIDEILFFDEKRLRIRRKKWEKTVQIEYKRYGKVQKWTPQ